MSDMVLIVGVLQWPSRWSVRHRPSISVVGSTVRREGQGQDGAPIPPRSRLLVPSSHLAYEYSAGLVAQINHATANERTAACLRK